MNKKSIDRRWLPLNALRAFEGVAKHGSFTAAANALLISQSALSRHVIALERLVGVQLFDRKPHALSLTKAGQHLLTAVVKSFDRLEYALDDIRNDGAPTQRTLRVQMPPSFAVQLAVPILRDLLWPVRPTLLCHPNIAAKHAGKDLGAFIEANEIVHVRIADLPRHHSWSQFVRQNGVPLVSYERGLVFDTAVLAVQYALSGQGVALCDPNLFSEELRQGRLVKPFEASLDDGYGYYLITHPEALGDTAIALFRSWLIERFGTHPKVPGSAVHLAVSNE
jgi:DNA-binding transcriptional LysR family regulator